MFAVNLFDSFEWGYGFLKSRLLIYSLDPTTRGSKLDLLEESRAWQVLAIRQESWTSSKDIFRFVLRSPELHVEICEPGMISFELQQSVQSP